MTLGEEEGGCCVLWSGPLCSSNDLLAFTQKAMYAARHCQGICDKTSTVNVCQGVARTAVYIPHIKADSARGRMQFSGRPGKGIYCT